MQDIHPIKPPVQTGFDPMPVIIGLSIIAAVLFFVLVFIFIRKRMRNKKPEETCGKVCNSISPYQEALKALERLSLKPGHDPRLFYFDLNAVLRRYVGRTFAINAIEMTSQEFVKSLGLLKLDTGMRQEISSFQDQCDPIKYAGCQPDTARLNQDLSWVKQKIEKIETLKVKKEEMEKARAAQNHNQRDGD